MATTKKRSTNQKLFDRYVGRMKTFVSSKDASETFASINKGKNSYMRMDRVESSSFDLTWINKIEDCLYDLGEIITNPRENTKTVANLVPVELARKTNAESVRHLASHTQYIKNIDENNNVIPSKILNIANEEDIHTYENRFIATLIRILVLFVEKRYEIVKHFSLLHDEEILYFRSSSIIGGEEVEIETKIKVKSLSESKDAITSNSYVNRIEKIREYILYYYNSPFMRQMKTDKNVRSPILMTNILRKNPKYHKCYELYRFIERYDSLGVGYKVNEDVFNYTTKELEDLNTVILANYLALKSKDKKKKIKAKQKNYKPKILKSIDDEEFVYDDLLKGPFEFVRVDKEYQDYLEAKTKKNLPEHPTKLEKEYFEEEIKEKKDVKETQKEKEKLVKRKEKQAKAFDKKAKAMIERREKEAREEEARRLALIKAEEEKRIEEERKSLVSEAKVEKAEQLEQARLEKEREKEEKMKELAKHKAMEEEATSEPLNTEETPTEVKETEAPENKNDPKEGGNN